MKLLAIDGNSIMNRAFYGVKDLSNSKGVYTNAIAGFMNIFLREYDYIKPDCIAVAFDVKAPTFRHKAFSEYKANRKGKGMPPELISQMPLIEKILTAMGIKCVSCAGWEGDDILGTLSEIFSGEDSCFIVTGDRDNLQLITDTCSVRLATNSGTVSYCKETFKKEYGFEPLQLIDYKALRGDSSDNIPGVKGIGDKGATSLILECETVEKVYDKLEELNITANTRKKLENGKEDAFMSKFLATIKKDAPIDRSKEAYLIGKRDNEKLKEILTDLEMYHLIQKLNATKIEINKTKYPLKELASDKIPTGESSFIFEDNWLEIFYDNTIYYTTNKDLILSYFASEYKKRSYEGKSAYKFTFENNGILNNLSFAADLAAYLLNSNTNDYSIKNLCTIYNIDYRSDMNEFEDISSLDLLCNKLQEELRYTNMEDLYLNIELPLCEVLASMEYYGIQVKVEGIKEFGKYLSEEIEILTEKIYVQAGEEFTISSSKQLGNILFNKLKLPVIKKTKTGYSTDADVLEELRDAHPIIPFIMEYRTLSKLNSTYVEGLLKQIHSDGRVHSVFKQTEARTGRISSAAPNIQNIPVRKEIGKQMRKFFVAKEGNLLVDADYSQIELRVLANVSEDKNMQEAFLSGKDIHTLTASQVFGVPEENIDSAMRSAAKAVNFGIIYGISAFSLSKDIGIPVTDAKEYIENYLNNFPKISEFMDKTINFAKKTGYVNTIFGRRRYIPEIKSSNKIKQGYGIRAAMNAPIQGAAADIIKIAMIKTYKRLKTELPEAKLLLQVHDELILEVPEKSVKAAENILKEEMESAVSLKVPFTADVHSGKSWFDAKS